MSSIIKLEGCKSRPFNSYLKSLGIIRLLAEQKDKNVRGFWKENTFQIKTELTGDALIKFFLNEYAPSPLFGPWGARSGFYPKSSEKSAREALENLINQPQNRFEHLRTTAKAVYETKASLGYDKEKPGSDEEKLEFLKALRSQLPDDIIDWLDVCYVLTIDSRSYMPLLGTGGNEGSGSYFSNYLQALSEVFIQRATSESKELLENSFFRMVPVAGYSDINTGQFDPSAIAEANSIEGFRSKSKIVNPWDFILALEGTVLFAGAPSCRLTSEMVNDPVATFPFTVRPTRAGVNHLSQRDATKEQSSFEWEIWVPLWDSPSSYREIKHLFSEGRAQLGQNRVRTGMDFTKAVASLGVDRGITAFVRYGRIKRQGGGKNANALAIPLETRYVRSFDGVKVLNDIDSWLNKLRRECKNKRTAKRYGKSLREVEDAILNYCKYGDSRRLQEVLITLGKAERSFATGGKGKSGEGRPVRPLSSMSPEWIKACYDGSPEYRIACALASIYDKDVGPIRFQLEPVDLKKGKLRWVENRKSTVWSRANLSRNMSNILQRRVLEGIQKSVDFIPVGGRMSANLKDVHEFLTARLNDRKIIDLFWGLSTVKWHQFSLEEHGIPLPSEQVPNISRFYALMKLLHLPGNIRYENGRWKLVYSPEEGISIAPEPGLLRFIERGDVGKATGKAAYRLKASGLQPKGYNRGEATLNFNVDSPDRTAAALLIPVREIDRLCRSMLNAPAEEKNEERGATIVKV